VVFCGAPATSKRPGSQWFAEQFFCAAHAQPIDVPIAGERVFRRVRLSADVLFAAVDANPPMAQAEALERLERAIEAVGGLLDVSRVTSGFVRWTPPAGRSARPTAAGDPE
jgi:hypothetical protein